MTYFHVKALKYHEKNWGTMEYLMNLNSIFISANKTFSIFLEILLLLPRGPPEFWHKPCFCHSVYLRRAAKTWFQVLIDKFLRQPTLKIHKRHMFLRKTVYSTILFIHLVCWAWGRVCEQGKKMLTIVDKAPLLLRIHYIGQAEISRHISVYVVFELRDCLVLRLVSTLTVNRFLQAIAWKLK